MYGKRVEVPRYLQMFSRGALTVRVGGNDFYAKDLKATDSLAMRYLEQLLLAVNGVTANWPSSSSQDSSRSSSSSSNPDATAECPRQQPIYNTVLANWYPSGNDYIGWHGDREKGIESRIAPIISVSLGAGRRFQVRKDANKANHENPNTKNAKPLVDILLEDGDCVIMGGAEFQTRFKHRVPKMVARKDGEVGARINLTIRRYSSCVAASSGGPGGAVSSDSRNKIAVNVKKSEVKKRTLKSRPKGGAHKRRAGDEK